MPFLWLKIDDEPSKDSQRAYLEKNIIALLSNFNKEEVIDEPSGDWLGSYYPLEKVKNSGLWNSNYVDIDYDPAFLKIFQMYIKKM